MFPTRILLAADGSEDAKRVIKTAIGLCTKLESELHVVYVAPEHPYVHAYYDLRHQEEEERLRRADQRVLDERVDHLRKAGGTVTESYLRLGEAAKEIVELAEELEVGLVVLRSRGLGGIRRALMGSVSRSVLTHAHCSVLIVRGYGPEQEARTREALIEAMGIALPAVRARDARGFFGHCGHGSVGQPL